MSKKQKNVTAVKNTEVAQVTEAPVAPTPAPVATATVKTPTRYEIRKTKMDALAQEFHDRVKKLREDREALRLAHKAWIAEVYEPQRQAIEAEFNAAKKVVVVKVEETAKAPEKVEA